MDLNLSIAMASRWDGSVGRLLTTTSLKIGRQVFVCSGLRQLMCWKMYVLGVGRVLPLQENGSLGDSNVIYHPLITSYIFSSADVILTR